MVSVDYADILAVTLPRNLHHFEEVWIVTASRDAATRTVAESCGPKVKVFLTDSFWADGAVFNKWRALEEGLDAMGREGWLALMDADVTWPKDTWCHPVDPLCRFTTGINPLTDWTPGNLYSPLRRMWDCWPETFDLCQLEGATGMPAEGAWRQFLLHRNTAEWAGYTQIFHASDPVLGPPPWHQVDWRHAGGADSFFQRKWRPENKVRPPWEVLHLGPAGANWMGRASRLADGRRPEGAGERAGELARMWRERRMRESRERMGEVLPGGVFGPERL